MPGEDLAVRQKKTFWSLLIFSCTAEQTSGPAPLMCCLPGLSYCSLKLQAVTGWCSAWEIMVCIDIQGHVQWSSIIYYRLCKINFCFLMPLGSDYPLPIVANKRKFANFCYSVSFVFPPTFIYGWGDAVARALDSAEKGHWFNYWRKLNQKLSDIYLLIYISMSCLTFIETQKINYIYLSI